jgi:2-polyprenyl-3-methyl-5-hydroxy-6-metoxy-1,4-benzoquinol methylase
MSHYTLKVGHADSERLNIQSLVNAAPLIQAVSKWKQQELLPTSFENKVLLDFGCGVGSALDTLLELFPGAHYMGCEQAKESIECASKTYPKTEFVVGTEYSSEIVSQADIIFIRFVIMHQPDPETFIKTILSAMKPDSILLIFEPYTDVEAYEYLIKDHPILADVLTKRLKWKFALGEKKGNHNLNYAPKISIPHSHEQIINIKDVSLKQLREFFIKNFESSKDDYINFQLASSDEIDHCITVLREAADDIPVYLGTAYIFLLKYF